MAVPTPPNTAVLAAIARSTKPVSKPDISSALQEALKGQAPCGVTKTLNSCTGLQLFPGQVIRRVQPFAVAFHELAFKRAPDQSKGQWTACDMEADLTQLRQIDLVGQCFVHMHLNRMSIEGLNTDAQVAWVNDVGHAALECVEMEIGGKQVEKKDGLIMHALAQSGPRGAGLNDADLRGQFDEEPFGQYYTISDAARLFAATDRHLYTDLQLFCGHDEAGYFPIKALKQHKAKVKVRIRSWIDLVRAWDPSAPTVVAPPEGPLTGNFVSNAAIQANVTGGEMLSCTLGYYGVYLDRESSALAAYAGEVKPLVQNFKYVHRNFKQPVLAGEEKVSEARLDGRNASTQRVFFYRRRSATGDNSPKSYFDFSTRINNNLVPATLRAEATIRQGVQYPITPFASVEFKLNNHALVSAPGEFYHLVNPVVARQNRVPSHTYIHSLNHDVRPHQSFNRPAGSVNDSAVDNRTVDFVMRAQHDSGTGLIEDGDIFMYSVKWAWYKINKGQFILGLPTV